MWSFSTTFPKFCDNVVSKDQFVNENYDALKIVMQAYSRMLKSSNLMESRIIMFHNHNCDYVSQSYFDFNFMG